MDIDVMRYKTQTFSHLKLASQSKKIIAFGVPDNMLELLDKVDEYEISISYFVDNDAKKSFTKKEGYEIKPPSAILDENKNEIAILIFVRFQFVWSVINQLVEMGISDCYSMIMMIAREKEAKGIFPSFKYIDDLHSEAVKLPDDPKCFLTKNLHGYGVEFGAGTRPFLVPDGCHVEYADFFPHAEGEFYTSLESENLEVPITYKTSMDEMEGIAAESLDFILSAHVIEHLRNPFKVFEKAYEKLKAGGKLILVVPNKPATFDYNRELTSLEHIDMDYNYPSRERDLLHYIEFFVTVQKVSLETIYEKAREVVSQPTDLHFHTFTCDSFLEMAHYFSEHYYRFAKIEHFPPLEVFKFIEFYVVLTK